MNVQSILGNKGRTVATVTSIATLADVAAQLRDLGVGALVVSDDGEHIVGIVSERDVVRALAAHGASALVDEPGRPVVVLADASAVRAIRAAITAACSLAPRYLTVLPTGGAYRVD